MGRNKQIDKQGDNDMKLRRIITCICILFMAVYSHAQNILNGTIESEEGVKIEYATVRLLTPDSIFVAGTITDTKGNYQVKVNAGKYILIVSMIGYKTQSMPVTIASEKASVPLIKLQNENVMLDAVTVTASSIVRKEDHLLIHPDEKQTKHASTGYDLLNNLMIPGIDVDRKAGKVKTFGTAGKWIIGKFRVSAQKM